jgi:hypothetical protein
MQFDVSDANYWAAPLGHEVRDDIVSIFGSDPWPTREWDDRQQRFDWLGLGVAALGVRDAEYMFVSRGSNASYGPFSHRYVFLHDNDIGLGNGTVAHELGHSFRLNHPWDVGATNPLTGAGTLPRDYWDLAYCPGSSAADPHRFFADKATADVGCTVGDAQMIYGAGVGTQYCSYSTWTYQMQCTLPGRPGTGYNQNLYHDDPALLRGGLRRAVFGTPSQGTQSALALWNPGALQVCLQAGVGSAGSTTIASCGSMPTVGTQNAIPLGGLRNPTLGSGPARMAWIAEPHSGTTPVLWRQDVGTGGTTGLTARSLTGARSRGTASFVGDMGTGANADGLPDLLVEGDSEGRWLIFWSHLDYASATTLSLGGHGSRML